MKEKPTFPISSLRWRRWTNSSYNPSDYDHHIDMLWQSLVLMHENSIWSATPGSTAFRTFLRFLPWNARVRLYSLPLLAWVRASSWLLYWLLFEMLFGKFGWFRSRNVWFFGRNVFLRFRFTPLQTFLTLAFATTLAFALLSLLFLLENLDFGPWFHGSVLGLSRQCGNFTFHIGSIVNLELGKQFLCLLGRGIAVHELNWGSKRWWFASFSLGFLHDLFDLREFLIEIFVHLLLKFL